MRAINFSDARRNLKAEFDRVVDDADVTIITRRDAEDVVVMSLAEWNSWQETQYLLASPANARHLREAIERLNAGEVEYHELIEPAPEAPTLHEARAAYKTGTTHDQTTSTKRPRKRK